MKMSEPLWWFIASGLIAGYFATRGLIEGMLFSKDGIEAGKYHFFRLLESFYVIAFALFVTGDLKIIAAILFSLTWYEIALSHSQYGTFPPPETIVYELLDFRIFVTPLMKATLAIVYFVLGLVVLKISGGF